MELIWKCNADLENEQKGNDGKRTEKNETGDSTEYLVLNEISAGVIQKVQCCRTSKFVDKKVTKRYTGGESAAKKGVLFIQNIFTSLFL